jgi:uncharacterized protein YkwD
MRWTVALVLAGCGPATPPSAPAPAPTPVTIYPYPSPRPATEPAPRPEPPREEPASSPPIVELHNQLRAEHCAPPLAWSADLAKVAQTWANKLRDKGCVFEHSRTELGENLAMGTSGALDDRTIVEMWYREVDKYDFRHPRFEMDTGHFTQLVWVGTQRIGCGRSTCKGMDIVVCNYDPPGNVETWFADNVLSTSCKRSR